MDGREHKNGFRVEKDMVGERNISNKYYYGIHVAEVPCRKKPKSRNDTTYLASSIS